jgi:aldose 1-epimerase
MMKRFLFLLLALPGTAWSDVKEVEFGTTGDGQPVRQFILSNSHGLEARVMSYGATWTHLIYPDQTDILLGFDSLSGYLGEHPYFGSTVGRVGNRIARGQFSLDGKKYQLAINNGPNHLHGGLQGLDKVVWQAQPQADGVRFQYRDPDGHNGYPGNVDMQVTYTLTDEDELRIDYLARTDQATPINLTNHAYFNLAGGGTILDQELWLNASAYTPVDDTLIPTGEIRPVAGGPFDFTTMHAIGRDLAKVGGYDHNFVVDGEGMREVARARDPKSGRELEISSDQPGVQFYTGNFLDGKLNGKKATAYPKHGAFCLETQHFPDSINHPNFPDTVLRPGQEYRTSTIHKFRWKQP